MISGWKVYGWTEIRTQDPSFMVHVRSSNSISTVLHGKAHQACVKTSSVLDVSIDELTHILKWNISIVRLKWKICVSIKAFCMWSFLSFKTLWAFTDLLHIILSLSFHHIHYALISFYVKKFHFLGQSLPRCLSLNSRFILYNLVDW